jgi:hypothetical protein
MIDTNRECLVRITDGYVRDLGDPEHLPDQVFIASRKTAPPRPCSVVLYNQGFTAIASWRVHGREKTCFVSVVPAHVLLERRKAR